MKRHTPTGDDTGTHIPIPRSPATPNGPDSAATDPAGLLVRFECEVMPFLDRLYMAATHMTHAGAHAEDLVQKTYLQAFRVFGALTAGTDRKVWLFQLLADSAFHTTGEWHRPPRSNSSTACPCRRPTEKHHPRFREPGMPDAQALERLPDQEVKAALRRLPQELAILVHLADAEDFSPTEIADVLGISENTATSLLLHGRHCLLHAFTDASRRQGLLDR